MNHHRTGVPRLNLIRNRLRGFDGKDLGPLRRLASELPAEPETVSRLLELLPTSEDSIELGATWLVKNLLEQGDEPLPAARARRLVHRLMDCRLDWSRLHLLQALPRTRLGEATGRQLEPTLWQWLEEIDHGFTRAWIYDGLVRVAGRTDSRRPELLQAFAAAYDHERPAVRARLRHLIQELERRL